MLSDDFEALTGSKAMRAFLAQTRAVDDAVALSRRAEEAMTGRNEVARVLAEQDRIRDTILERNRISDRVLELDRLSALALERESRMLNEARRAAEATALPRGLTEASQAAQALQDHIRDVARAAIMPQDYAMIDPLRESIQAAVLGGLAERALADTAMFRQVADDFIRQRDLISRFVRATAIPDFEAFSSDVVTQHLTDTLSETLAAVRLDGTAATVSFEELALGWYGRVRPEWRTYDVLMFLLTLLGFIYMVLSGHQQGRQLSRIAANSDSILVEQRRERELADSNLAEQRRANALADSSLMEQRPMNRMLENSCEQQPASPSSSSSQRRPGSRPPAHQALP